MRFRGFLIIVVLLGVFVSMPAVAESRTSQGAEAALEVQRARSSGGTYLVEIRSAEPIPLNEIFSLEFRVFDASTPKNPSRTHESR
jgi:hypothetical protein